MDAKQKNLQSVVSPVQREIDALAAGLENNRDYLPKPQDVNRDRAFVELGRIFNGKVIKSKNTLYEEPKQTLDVYTNG